MSAMWRRRLWLWAGIGIPAGILCQVFLPFSPTVRWLAFLLVVMACVIGTWRTRRKPDTEFTGGLPGELPGESYRLPVVLVCGDDLESLFGNSTVLQTAAGCWLRIADSRSLHQSTRQILWQRPEWANQLAIMLVANPQQQGDERALSARLHELRWQWVQLSRDIRRALPLVIYSIVATSLAILPVWLSRREAHPLTLWPTVTMPETLANWQRAEVNSAQAGRFKQTILLSAHNDWLNARVLPVFQDRNNDVACVSPQQVILSQVNGMKNIEPASLWYRWLVARTALTQVSGWHPGPDAENPHPLLPDFIFSDLPSGSGESSRRRMLRQTVTASTLIAMMALGCSAWHNQHLLRRVAFDIRQYESVEMRSYGPKAKAVEILHQHAAQLDDWLRHGNPLRLGLGLYQGERLRLPLFMALKTYAPPLTPSPSPSPSPGKYTPETVRLDALSLFDTGKHQLKPNSTKMLLNALIGVKAKPGWLIVVSGHTDITGDARANQILSLKRAEALRDWMLSTSDLSPTRFAVQGYGATRPIAMNDTPEGRAANRRVEISLVPQANAWQATASQHVSND
ncbi:OmpA family protein [Acerihabitans sp.]|uniref:OmpA family protein n=1 Tax=Acerihabitans sp. TaxID=2811394 RepID=UPI002EDBA1D5